MKQSRIPDENSKNAGKMDRITTVPNLVTTNLVLTNRKKKSPQSKKI